MTNTCQLSNNTITYLQRYQNILDEMIHDMSSVKLTCSISGSFIVQMIPHHCAAIKMSENLLLYTTDLSLQEIALTIISSQKKSIETMVAAYPCCQTVTNSCEDLAAYQSNNQCILKTMFHEMCTACAVNNIDASFMYEMIPHHMGAVRMSENALRYPLCKELVPILEAIITSQKKGICEMQMLLQQQKH